MNSYKTPCQCEHEDHFNGKDHDYGDAAAVVVLKTTLGTFHVCQSCAWHLKDYTMVTKAVNEGLCSRCGNFPVNPGSDFCIHCFLLLEYPEGAP
jgi:hypothetical protein